MNKLVPVVSVCVQTFQHVNFIEQCLESILMQETNFPFEILLRDDASTDGTREICQAYKAKYPDIINLLIYSENQWQKGVRPFLDNVRRARGKYIAICEGDDYWTDKNKLADQVSFLMNNPKFTFTYHQFDITNTRSMNDNIDHLLKKNKIPPNSRLDLNYYIKKRCVKTMTVVANRKFIDYRVLDFLLNTRPRPISGDVPFFILLLAQGPAYVFNKKMAVYRYHDGGITNTIRNSVLDYFMITYIKLYFGYLKEHRSLIFPKIGNQLKSAIVNRRVQYVFNVLLLILKSMAFWSLRVIKIKRCAGS